MSKKKLAGIIVGCTLGVLAIVLAVVYGPTGLPAMTEEEQSYMSFIEDNSNTVYIALGELIVLMDEFEIGVDEWTPNMAIQVDIIQRAYSEASQMNPPTSMAHIHSKYIRAMSNFSDSAYLMVSSIDSLDSAMLDDAKVKFESGLQYLEQWADLLNAFRAEHK
jgi:hypothetical protein